MELQRIILAVIFLLHDLNLNLGAPADTDGSYVEDPLAETDSNLSHQRRDIREGDQIYISGDIGVGGSYSYSGGWDSPNSNSYSTTTRQKTKNGRCVTEVTIKGKGVNDKFEFPCSAGTMSAFTSNEDVLVTNQDTVQSYSVYSMKPKSVQVILDGKCSVKSYTTSNGKTSAATYSVVGAACDAMKKEHLQRLQKWQQWEKETFPPCFPFCGNNNPGNSNPKPYVGTVNTGYNNVWSPPAAGNTGNANTNAAPVSSNSNSYTLPASGLASGSGFGGTSGYASTPPYEQLLSSIFQMLGNWMR